MRIQQIFVALVCIFASTQQIVAVVNNAQTKPELNGSNVNSESSSSSGSANVADSLAAASSEKEASRREAPVPHEVYGPPQDSYVPSAPSNQGLPVPVYGVPDAQTNNIIYPAPPPDIPPELTSALLEGFGGGKEVYGPPSGGIPFETYGPPKEVYGPPKEQYGPPQEIYGPPKESYGPPKQIFNPPKESYGPPKEMYGPPKDTYGPPKDIYGPPHFSFPKPPKIYNPPPFHKPKPIYGPPRLPHKPHFKPPKPVYGPPLKLQYGPPKHHFGPPKPHYGPPKEQYGPPPKEIYGPPKEQYGPPPKDSYGPPILPNINFNGPPKDQYGPPKLVELHGPPPKEHYGPPKEHYGPPKEHYGPPKDHYGPPKEHYGPPKEHYGPPKEHYGPPKEHYGPPKEHYGPPKEQYGPPKEHYGPPKEQYGPPKEQYGPPKIEFHGPPKLQYGPPKYPKDSYGPPKLQGPPKDLYGPPHAQYGPPEPVVHGPPRPGIPAPPTPPDIKYDGWQPIPGLVSKPPSGTYAPHHPHGQSHSHGHADLHFNGDFVPPPAIGHGISSLSLGSSYGNTAGISDSYGAPLNTVTGSGGIVSTSGDAHIHNQDQSAISLGLSAAGIGSGYDGQLSVIKSIGYEIFPHGSSSVDLNSIHGGGDSYSAPPLNSYSSNGPYAASHSYKNNGISSNFHSNFGKELSLSLSSDSSFSKNSGFSSSFNSNFDKGVSSIGLIPPSGLYGVPPSGQYGTPLLSTGPPKHPVVFREPVPTGLIQSIGNFVAQKDAAGVIESSHSSSFNGPTYIPPPVPELNLHDNLKAPTSLYSLPNPASSVSFNSGSHSSSSHSHSAFSSSFSNNGLSSTSTAYAAPLQTHVALDHSLPAQTIDLTHYGSPSFGSIPHDCSAHKSLPQLSYGVPSANSYTASLSSLKTNIGGGQYPSLSYGTPDLQAAHSVKTSVSNGASINSIEEGGSKEQYGKSLAETFAPGGEVIKSQSIDFNNIPVQGALGAYTLQIQAADGAAGTDPSSVTVPHDQVLNDGLLQSILAAIEQPQSQPQYFPERAAFSQISGELQLPIADEPQLFVKAESDDEAQHSIKTPVVVLPPTVDSNKANGTESETESSLHLIDDNEIALYFHNNQQSEKTQSDSTDSESESNSKTGSYVSVKTPNTSYNYGDLKPEAQK